jgi:hypothetical protein
VSPVQWLLAAGLSWATLGCGRVETVVGAETPDLTGSDGVAPAMDASADDASPEDAGDSGPDFSACDMPDGSSCLGTLANIGQGDFRISLMVTTAQVSHSALVNQRASCGHGRFWDIRIDKGKAGLETDDGTLVAAHYAVLWSLYDHITDGRPHCLAVRRVSGVLAMSVDGFASGMAQSLSTFTQLPAVVTGLDPCDGDGGCPLACRDGTNPFVGTVSNLCVTSP